MTDLAPALAALRSGGIIAYPTEAVWGLGCDPFDQAAVTRLLRLKQRPVDKGLILVAAEPEQFEGLLDWDAVAEPQRSEVSASWPGPHTWIVPATARVPAWITGAHRGVAVRVSAHPTVAALCRAFAGPLVSTSANPTGAEPPRRLEDFDPALRDRLDAIVPGSTGELAAPTPIRDAVTGQVLRA